MRGSKRRAEDPLSLGGGPGLEESFDFAEDGFAAFVPFFRAAEDEDAFADAGEVNLSGSVEAEFFELGAEGFEKSEFVAGAGLHGGVDEGDGERRGDGLEVFGDVRAADFHEKLADFVEEVVEVEEPEVAVAFEVVGDAVADLADEGKILQVRGAGGAEDGVIQPCGVVVEHLMASDLDGGAIADE